MYKIRAKQEQVRNEDYLEKKGILYRLPRVKLPLQFHKIHVNISSACIYLAL